MSKKRHRKKKKSKRQNIRHQSPHNQTPQNKTGITYQQMPPLFEGMSDAEIVEHLKAVGEGFEREFENTFHELRNRLLTIDPLSLLALFTFYGLASFDGRDPELTQDEPILQHHIELLQAFVLQHQLDEFEFKPVVPQVFNSFQELIRQVSRAFSYRRLTVLDTTMSKAQRRRLAVQEVMRLDTQAIRNWGYAQQIRQITTELFSELDQDIEIRVGARVAYLIDMFSKIGDVIDDRLNFHLNLLFPMMRAQTIESAVKEYYLAFPDLQSESDGLIQFFRQHDAELEQVKFMLISHSDLRLRDIFTLTLDDFLAVYPGEIAPETLQRILKDWTLAFGDLADQNTEYFFMGNPIWGQPLIHLGEKLFFWPIPSIFLSFCVELMEQVIRPYPELYAKYEEQRGKFLEDKIEYLFRSTIPYANVYRGSQWLDPVTNRNFENDLLVRIDTHLIVIEAKSGKVSAPARRGAEHRLQRIINDLIVSPSIQADRFANYLQENPGIHRFSTRSGVTNEIDTSNVREVIRLNITLEPIGMLQTRLPELQEAGFMAQGVDFAPVMLFADLEIIFEILDRTCEKLHYLRRRTQFERNSNYFGDETDLLAFYLETGFNIREAEFDGTFFFLHQLSKTLDPYFMRKWHPEEISKPSRTLTSWWGDLLDYIEKLQTPRWAEVGFILLNVAYEDQIEFEKGFKGIQKVVQKHWRRPNHKNIYMLPNGPEQRRDALVGVAYKELDIERRNQLLLNAGNYAIEQASSDQALITVTAKVTYKNFMESSISF